MSMATRQGSLDKKADHLRPPLRGATTLSANAQRCRQKFLHLFPGGYSDETYVDWERRYKWEAHERFCEVLRRSTLELVDYHAVPDDDDGNKFLTRREARRARRGR